MTVRVGSAGEVRGGLGALGGWPVIENRNAPAGMLLTLRLAGVDHLVVRSAWSDLRQPLMLAEMRKSLQAHLAAVVADAESRLFGGVR